MSKNILFSKTLWINLLGTAVVVLSSGMIPTKYSVPALGVINIINRFLTDGAVHLIS